MNYKAIGTQTKTVYIIGSHADCSKYVNSLLQDNEPYKYRFGEFGHPVVKRHDEPIRILPEHVAIETDEEYLERMEKEMRLLELQAEQRKMEEAEQRKQERANQREAEAKVRRERLDELRRQKSEQKQSEKTQRQELVYGKWEPEELAFIRANHNKLTRNQISEQLGRRRSQLNNQITKMLKNGELDSSRTKWTQADDDFIIANHHKLKLTEIAAQLGKTKHQMNGRVEKLMKAGKIKRKMHRWTAKEDAFIIANYKKIKSGKMAAMLGVTPVQMRAHVANLKVAGKL